MWNMKTTSIGKITSNTSSGGRPFTAADVDKAIASVGPVTYNVNETAEMSSTTDCAGYVNQLVGALGGTAKPRTLNILGAIINTKHLGVPKDARDWAKD